MQYVVQPGDTLSAIGAKLGVDWKTITGYRSGDPNKIYIGENLNVPDKVAPTPAAPAPALTPTGSTSSSTPTPTPSGDLPSEQNLINAMVAKGHSVETAKAAIAGRGVTDLAREYLGYTGSSSGTPAPADVSSILTPNPTIDLTSTYDEAYKSAGIADLEKELSEKRKQLTAGQATITNNPWLSATEQGGRITKLKEVADQEITNLQNDITLKKADVETKINLKLKQIDINSQASKDALSNLNTLLSLGAMTNVSADQIAKIAKVTGLSTAMITSAVDYAKSKNVETEIKTEEDNAGNVTYITLNKKTGEVIKRQSMGKIGKGKAATTTETAADRKRGVFSEVQQELNRLGGSDKFVSPAEWQYMRQQWIAQGYDGKDFDDAFRATYVGSPASRGFKLSDFGLK